MRLNWDCAHSQVDKVYLDLDSHSCRAIAALLKAVVKSLANVRILSGSEGVRHRNGNDNI